jgi:hypothetical protein
MIQILSILLLAAIAEVIAYDPAVAQAARLWFFPSSAEPLRRWPCSRSFTFIS